MKPGARSMMLETFLHRVTTWQRVKMAWWLAWGVPRGYRLREPIPCQGFRSIDGIGL